MSKGHVYSDKVKIYYFRLISAYNVSTVKASEKVQLSRIGRRLRAYRRAIDEVRTLPLTPPNCPVFLCDESIV